MCPMQLFLPVVGHRFIYVHTIWLAAKLNKKNVIICGKIHIYAFHKCLLTQQVKAVHCMYVTVCM